MSFQFSVSHHCLTFILKSSTAVPLGHKSINLIKKEEVNNDNNNNNNKRVGSKQCNHINWRKKFDEPVHETIPQGLLNLSFEQVFWHSLRVACIDNSRNSEIMMKQLQDISENMTYKYYKIFAFLIVNSIK
jgi:hypothetical protein